jgi:hypothetical protein
VPTEIPTSTIEPSATSKPYQKPVDPATATAVPPTAIPAEPTKSPYPPSRTMRPFPTVTP